MGNNITYRFERTKSDELPPRFRRLIDSLEEAGVYNAEMEHPNADWNCIAVRVLNEDIDLERMKNVFREVGYYLS